MRPTPAALVLVLLIAWMLSTMPAAAQALRQPESGSSPFGDAQIDWDKEAAAKYLDERMDLWFTKAKKLRTGQDSAACVSCHTVVPYALARPALRRATGLNKPTAQEVKLLAQIVRRVETYGSHDPFYKGQEEQSRGTEAVLNLFILVSEDDRQDHRIPSEPVRKALEELWKEQRTDGTWNWLDFGLEPYESTGSVYYGAALAGIAVGSIPGYAGNADTEGKAHIARLCAYLNEKYSEQNLHNKVWMLLASSKLGGLLTDEQQEKLMAELERHQQSDGGWSLQKLGPWTWSKTSGPFHPEGKPDASLLWRSDGYATGLITYAAQQAGLTASHSAFRKTMYWLKTHQQGCQIEQNEWKCWRTHSLNFDREHGGDEGEPWRRMFMSDAATGFAVLALLPAD
jgi:hypothetical protein